HERSGHEDRLQIRPLVPQEGNGTGGREQQLETIAASADRREQQRRARREPQLAAYDPRMQERLTLADVAPELQLAPQARGYRVLAIEREMALLAINEDSIVVALERFVDALLAPRAPDDLRLVEDVAQPEHHAHPGHLAAQEVECGHELAFHPEGRVI